MSDKPADKRLFPRHSLHRTVRVEVDGEVHERETNDIPQGGVSVAADTHLKFLFNKV